MAVASMAIGGVRGDVVGIRMVYLGAAGIVVAAAGVAFLMFRASRAARPSRHPSSPGKRPRDGNGPIGSRR